MITFPSSALSIMSNSYVDIMQQFERIIVPREGLHQRTHEARRAYKDRKKEFISQAVLSGFLANFGGDVDDLEAWKRICTTIRVPNVGELLSVSQCQEVRCVLWKTRSFCLVEFNSGPSKARNKKFVNIIDLVDAANAGRQLPQAQVFRTRKSLSRYIQETEKYFDCEVAKSVPLLEEFLIVV
jgi:hypothetical protein